MRKLAASLNLGLLMLATSASAAVTNFGPKHDIYSVDAQCPGEGVHWVIPDFYSARSQIDNQLRIMKINGANTISLLVGIGAAGGAATIYPNIFNETDQNQIADLNAYFTVVKAFS